MLHHAMQELFEQAGGQLSSELEDIAAALFRKAGEVSTAGRDNFLTQCADAALSQMVLSCPEVATAKAFIATCALLGRAGYDLCGMCVRR